MKTPLLRKEREECGIFVLKFIRVQMRSGEVYSSACLKPSIKQSSDMVGVCISASHVVDLVKIV